MALTVAAVLFLCAKHLREFQKLQAEIDTNSSKRGLLDDINQLIYLDQVVKEALRLYPSVPLFIREARPGQSVELANYQIPQGTQIFISSWAFHRNTGRWNNPEEFIPERFSQEPPPYHYFPFGVGHRECAGKAYTMMCSKVMLFTLLSHFAVDFEPDRAFDTVYYSGTLMPKNGLPFKIRNKN